jgi:hypothetical protein
VATIQSLLGIPPHVAVHVVMPLGRPERSLTKLRRKPAADFKMRERSGSAPLSC